MSDEKLVEAMAEAMEANLPDVEAMARAALAVVRREDGWQPIETAPKGEHLLLWDGEYVQFGEYGWDEGEEQRPVFIHDGPGIRGVTHWRRPPKTPEQEPSL